MECWQWQGECLDTPPEGAYGFIYLIVDDTGKKYWGKKAFVHATKKKISKKVQKESGTRKRIERGTKDSKWADYWGSSLPLLEYIKERGTEGFQRHVLKICFDKQSLAYWEMVYLVQNEVLFRDDCWNGNVLAKFFKNKIHV